MSDSPNVPPGDPTAPIPALPPALHPVPVMPAAYAYPGQQLQYSTPAGVGGRPGLLTAIGVISIVVAALSGISSLSTGFQGIMFYSMSRMSPGPGTVTTSTGTSSASITFGGPGPVLVTPTTSPSGNPSGLTNAEIALISARVQTAAGGGLNPAQIQSLDSALANTSPPLVASQFVYSPVKSAFVDGAKTVTISFTGGTVLTIDSAGILTSQTAAFPGFPTVSVWQVAVSAVDGLGSMILAGILFVGGIMVFTRSPRALKLHWWFAWGKIPFAVLGAAGQGMLFHAIMGGAATPAAPGFPVALVATISAAFYLVLGLAYPVALQFALRSSSIRNYYQSIKG